MNELEYSYTILKYRHDVAAGEILNIGVALYCPSTGQAGIHSDQRYSRLSQAFAHFDGEMYKTSLRRLTSAVEGLTRSLSGNLFELEERTKFADVTGIVRAVWPDQGLSYFAGPVFYGITNDLNRELSELYDRFVLSQFDRREAQDRLDDEKLWDSFKRVLTPRGILEVLKPVTLGDAEVEFEHAYKNEKWHVYEPLSLDYLDSSVMKKRAFEVAGKVSSVSQVEEMGTFTVLLGKPRRLDAEKAYQNARRILRSASSRVDIVEDSEADRFAEQLEREMREHGLLGPK